MQKVLGKMFKWKNKSFSIFLMSHYRFQYQLPGQLVSTRIWIRPVLTFKLLTVRDALDAKSLEVRTFTIFLIFTLQISTKTAISHGISGALITEHLWPWSYINDKKLN